MLRTSRKKQPKNTTLRKYSSSGNHLHDALHYMEEQKGWWFIGKRSIITSMIDTFKPVPSKLAILDAGCGTGFILHNLKKYGNLYGLDINEQAVRICKQNGLKNVVCGSVLDLPFRKETFDIVILADIIEHIKNDKKVIREAYRVLKKNGIVIIHTPSNTMPWSILDNEFGHVRRYNTQRLKDILLQEKFTIQKISYTNFFLYFPQRLVRLIQKLFSNNLMIDPTGMKLLPGPLEILFTTLFRSESVFLKIIDFPIGVSLLAVAKKVNLKN